MGTGFHAIPFPIYILGLLFIAVAVRQVGRIQLPIWVSMSCAAGLVLLTGQISFIAAWHSINWEVIIYLWCVFVIGQALESSHYLERVSLNIFQKIHHKKILLLMFIMLFALCSALLMNDTIAIIGTPIVLLLSSRLHLPRKILLLTLAYTLTLGSIMSPIGNPQNLLIASTGLKTPFATFSESLFVPTLINLFLLYCIVLLLYRKHFQGAFTPIAPKNPLDTRLALLCQVSTLLLISLILVNLFASLFLAKQPLSFGAIALISAAPILLGSRRRFEILRDLDWHTLLFFIAMFIFMQSVWSTGFFQSLLTQTLGLDLTAPTTILLSSLSLSQLTSNVPLVALYLPLLKGSSPDTYLLLAVGSTLAGNMLILGAASNVIIIQNAEKRRAAAFSFWDFLKLGIPITVLNVWVYWLFLR